MPPPHPLPQALLRAFGFLCCSPYCSPPHPPESDTKESGSWAPAWEQSDQQDLQPCCQKPPDGEARRAGHGGGQEFSMNLFFFRLSFDIPTPQKSCHLPPPLPPALPHPSLCCWQSHAVTSHPLPASPQLPGAMGSPARAGPGAPSLCRAQNAGGREGRQFSPRPLGSATVPFLILKSQVQ